MNTPPKYPSSSHWPWSLTVHKDDRYHQNPEDFVGVEVVITEKLDGGNTCLSKGEVYARSTGQPAIQGWFAMVKKYHAWKTVNLSPATYVYGEDIAALHSIKYSVSMADTYFVFAIREGDIFLSYDDMVAKAASLDLPTTPLLFRGTFSKVSDITAWFSDNIKQPSAFGSDREGFVMRFAGASTADEFPNKIAKYVRAGHVQTNEHWTRNWQWNELDPV